jgi:hypothetical protein
MFYYQILIMFYSQIMFYCNPAYTANCPSEFIKLPNYQHSLSYTMENISYTSTRDMNLTVGYEYQTELL